MSKIKVCLTGGIASGKTRVSDQLAQMGFAVIDADLLARKVVEKDTVGLQQIISDFGAEVLNENGELNRPKLKSIVFQDKRKLMRLNSILHPLIWSAFHEQSAKSDAMVEVWVIPLFDNKRNDIKFDRVLVIDVSQEVQISRMQNRDGSERHVAESILASQPKRADRISLATDVVCNNDDFDTLRKNVDHIFWLYKGLKIH